MNKNPDFHPEVFLGGWKVLVGQDAGAELRIHFNDPENFSISKPGGAWTECVSVNRVNATLQNHGLSVSYWERGYPKPQPQIMAMKVDPEDQGWPDLRFVGADTTYSVWGCDFKSLQDPPIFDANLGPTRFPRRFVDTTWHVVAEHGSSGGRKEQWVRITRCVPRMRLFALSAGEKADGPWQLYDVLVYNNAHGSLDSILHHRSLCYWPKGERSKSAIYAMFDSRYVNGLPQVPEIRLMPVEKFILKCMDEDGGAGVWGAEEGG